MRCHVSNSFMMTGGISKFLMFPIHLMLPMVPNLFFEQTLDLSGTPWFHIRIKDKVNFLERSTRRLRIGEEDLEGHHETENAKDDICLPLNIRKSRSHEICEGKVEDPVRCRRYTDTFCAVLEWEDFRDVDPCAWCLYDRVSGCWI